MQIDRRNLAWFGQPADEAVTESGEILSPLQRRPFLPGRDIIKAMFGLCRFDQQRHGIRDVGSINPIPETRTGQNGLFSLLQGSNHLDLWTWRVAHPGGPLPRPEHATQPHAYDIGLP